MSSCFKQLLSLAQIHHGFGAWLRKLSGLVSSYFDSLKR